MLFPVTRHHKFVSEVLEKSPQTDPCAGSNASEAAESNTPGAAGSLPPLYDFLIIPDQEAKESFDLPRGSRNLIRKIAALAFKDQKFFVANFGCLGERSCEFEDLTGDCKKLKVFVEPLASYEGECQFSLLLWGGCSKEEKSQQSTMSYAKYHLINYKGELLYDVFFAFEGKHSLIEKNLSPHDFFKGVFPILNDTGVDADSVMQAANRVMKYVHESCHFERCHIHFYSRHRSVRTTQVSFEKASRFLQPLSLDSKARNAVFHSFGVEPDTFPEFSSPHKAASAENPGDASGFHATL